MSSISCVNSSLHFCGAVPYCALSSALSAGNQHNLVGSSGCGIVCDNIHCGQVAIRLFRVSAWASCKSEGEGSIQCYSSRLL